MPDLKTVASLDEWTTYADDTDEPIAHAIGELADQIRERFGADKHTPVILTEAFDSDDGACDCCTHFTEYLVIECGDHIEQIDRRDLAESFQYWLDAPRRRAEQEAAAKAYQERQEAEARAIAAAIHAAAEAVEAEGYRDDQEWHDKFMRHLGVKGYQK
ncbi:hypothetical protein [Nocardia africana]